MSAPLVADNVRFYLSYDPDTTQKSRLLRENANILSCVQIHTTLIRTSIHKVTKICKPLVVNRCKCMTLYHSQTRRLMIKDGMCIK